MVSQMLLGETAEILDRLERWVRIRTAYDDYEGWVNPGQCGPLSADEERLWLSSPVLNRNSSGNHMVVHSETGEALVVPFGAQVWQDPEGIRLPDGLYLRPDTPRFSLISGDLVDTAERLAGIPYLWGGRSDLGFDCSGFVQTLFAVYGYRMPRDSRQQFELAALAVDNLRDIAQAERGDLVFFANPEGRIVHVGIYVTDGCLVHAGPNVRINCFAPQWSDRVRFSYDERLAERFRGTLRLTDLILLPSMPRFPAFKIFDDRSPQIRT